MLPSQQTSTTLPLLVRELRRTVVQQRQRLRRRERGQRLHNGRARVHGRCVGLAVRHLVSKNCARNDWHSCFHRHLTRYHPQLRINADMKKDEHIITQITLLTLLTLLTLIRRTKTLIRTGFNARWISIPTKTQATTIKPEPVCCTAKSASSQRPWEACFAPGAIARLDEGPALTVQKNDD